MYSDPERQKEENRKRMRTKRMDPAYREKMNGYMKDYLPFYNRLKKYGITKEQYNQMLQDQGGVCKICSEPPTGFWKNNVPKKLCVDHDHSTNKVRGLLCDSCNVGLGKFRDNIEILSKAVGYLGHG